MATSILNGKKISYINDKWEYEDGTPIDNYKLAGVDLAKGKDMTIDTPIYIHHDEGKEVYSEQMLKDIARASKIISKGGE